MGKKAKEQGVPEQEQQVKEKMSQGINDRDHEECIDRNIDKIRFLADCLSTGQLEMTEDGRCGAFWILSDIADDLENDLERVAAKAD